MSGGKGSGKLFLSFLGETTSRNDKRMSVIVRRYRRDNPTYRVADKSKNTTVSSLYNSNKNHQPDIL